MRLGIVLLICLPGTAIVTHGQGSVKLEVGHFSVAAEGAACSDGWTLLTCKEIERHTTKVSLNGN